MFVLLFFIIVNSLSDNTGRDITGCLQLVEISFNLYGPGDFCVKSHNGFI